MGLGRRKLGRRMPRQRDAAGHQRGNDCFPARICGGEYVGKPPVLRLPDEGKKDMLCVFGFRSERRRESLCSTCGLKPKRPGRRAATDSVVMPVLAVSRLLDPLSPEPIRS